MAASISAQFAKQVGEAVKESCNGGKPGWWFSPHMAAASRAIVERIPLVFVVMDAWIPLSSECDGLQGDWLRSKSIVVLKEMDLANHSQIKEWLRHFEMKNRHCFAVNAHNTDNIKQATSALLIEGTYLMSDSGK